MWLVLLLQFPFQIKLICALFFLPGVTSHKLFWAIFFFFNLSGHFLSFLASVVGICLCLAAPPLLSIFGTPFSYKCSQCQLPWADALDHAKQWTKLNFSSLLAFQAPACFWIAAGETDEALFASCFAVLRQARLAAGTVPLQAYEDITHLLFAQVRVWVTLFIASGAQRWDCATPESLGSAEVGEPALEFFLCSMGEKIHSEYYFCHSSIKFLNTIQQGKKEEGEGTLYFPSFPPWSWEVQGTMCCSRGHGKASLCVWQLELHTGWQPGRDLKVTEIRLGS